MNHVPRVEQQRPRDGNGGGIVRSVTYAEKTNLLGEALRQ